MEMIVPCGLMSTIWVGPVLCEEIGYPGWAFLLTRFATETELVASPLNCMDKAGCWVFPGAQTVVVQVAERSRIRRRFASGLGARFAIWQVACPVCNVCKTEEGICPASFSCLSRNPCSCWGAIARDLLSAGFRFSLYVVS